MNEVVKSNGGIDKGALYGKFQAGEDAQAKRIEARHSWA